MKRKNEHQIFSYFGSIWVTMHVVCIVLLGGLFITLAFIGFSRMAGSNGGTTSPSVHVYLYAVPYIALTVTLIVFSGLQLLVSGHTLRIFPRVWPVYSTIGIAAGLGIALVAFGPQVELEALYSRYEKPHEFLYSSAVLIFISMGLFQAAVLARQYSLRGAVGWLLAHVLAGIFLNTQVLLLAVLSLPSLACATSPLCWYFYRLSRSQFEQSSSNGP